MSNRLIISLSVLIVAISVAYYLVIYIPKRDQQRADDIKRADEVKKSHEQAQQETAQYEKEQKKQQLDTCLGLAEESYTDNWISECKGEGSLTPSCLTLLDLSYSEYAKIRKITGNSSIDSYYKERDDCMCRLSASKADRLEKTRKESKDDCYKRAQL